MGGHAGSHSSKFRSTRREQLDRGKPPPPHRACFGCANRVLYEGASSDQESNGPIMIDGQSRAMTDFLATSEGLELVRAFTAIKDSKVRRRIVDVAKAVAVGGVD